MDCNVPAELASGNPTLAPLAIAGGLFVLLLGGVLVAMARMNHIPLRPQHHESTPEQRRYVKRRALYALVALALGVAAFAAIAARDNIVATCIAVPAAAWVIVGPRVVGARDRPASAPRSETGESPLS